MCPDDLCQVRLTVHIDFHLNQFYIKTGFGCSIHKEHPRLMSSEICALLATVPEEEFQIQRDLGTVHASCSIGSQLIKSRTGLNFSRKAIRKMMKQSRT